MQFPPGNLRGKKRKRKDSKIKALTTGRSERDHVVALVGIRVETSDWFGTPSSVRAGPVCAFIAVSPAGPTVAAEGHGVGEDRVGVDGTAGQHGCAVFHFVISTASLDKEAGAEYVPHVAVLLTTPHKHIN